MSQYSQDRIETKISQVISTLIVNGEIKNRKVNSLCSVSKVSLSHDNSYATVYISSFLEDSVLKKSVEGLQSAAPFIQGKLGHLLGTKNTPRLTFKMDTSYRDAQKINNLIDSLVQDGK
ncbi:MAG: 30S ribosome-binding factor RbfA [Spirochaetia bacterium]|jgi:ribosome-binding factor A|nr:30S ribosome-binding factor RbfA [Spirochaetia bacterium]